MAAPAVATTALTGLEQFAWPAAWDHPQFPDTIFRTHTLTCKDIHGAPIRIAQHVSNYLLKRFLRQGCEIRLPTIPLTLVESEGMQSYCSEGANKDQWKECIPPHSQAEENARKISFGVLPVFQDASGEWLCVLQRSLPRQTDDDQALKCDPLRAHQQELSSLDSDLQPAKDAAARGAAEKTNYALVLKESDLESAQCVDKDPQAGAIYWVHVQGDTAAWLERDNPRSLQNLYAANKKKMIDHLEKEEPGDGQTNEERLRHIHKTVSLHIFRLKDLLVMIHEEAEKYLATGKSPRITPENPLPDNAPFKAYVQRLPPTVSDQQLRSWFKLPTKRLHIHVPKPFPNQLAIAYVTFDSRAELEDFVRRNGEPFGGAEWAGWHLDVMVADTPEQAAERKAKFNKYNPRTDNPAQRTDKQPAAKARQYSAR